MRLAHYRDNGHAPTFTRRTSGYGFHGRPLYATTVACECGWRERTNEGKREAELAHNDHLRDVKASAEV